MSMGTKRASSSAGDGNGAVNGAGRASGGRAWALRAMAGAEASAGADASAGEETDDMAVAADAASPFFARTTKKRKRGSDAARSAAVASGPAVSRPPGPTLVEPSNGLGAHGSGGKAAVVAVAATAAEHGTRSAPGRCGHARLEDSFEPMVPTHHPWALEAKFDLGSSSSETPSDVDAHRTASLERARVVHHLERVASGLTLGVRERSHKKKQKKTDPGALSFLYDI